MKSLIRLFFIKKWAAVRNVFRKPLSAILTLGVIAIYAFSLVPMLGTSGKPAMDADTLSNCILLGLGMSFFLILMTFLTKNRALFFVQDSYYMFTGPYTQKKILSYLIFDAALSALVFGAISLFPMVTIGINYSIGIAFILQLVAALLLLHFMFLLLMDIIYVRDLIRGRQSKNLLLSMAVLFLCLAGVLLYCMSQNDFDPNAALAAFPKSQALYAVPGLGWVKLALDGGMMGALIGYGLLILFGIIFSLILINLKGEFYEKAMLDAENFTEYYEKAKSGQVEAKLKKGAVEVKWNKGIGAIFSKNLLLTRKTSFVTPSDLMIIVIYVGFCVWMQTDLLVLALLLLFYQFSSSSTTTLLEDLKYPYIYLMPGSALKKMLNSLAIPLIKNVLICVIVVVLSGVVKKDAPIDIFLVTLLSASFCLLTMMGNVISLRLLRSRSNVIVEQVLRMLVPIAALAPSILLLLLMNKVFTLETWTMYSVVIVVDFLIGILGLLACAPMMNGRELASD